MVSHPESKKVYFVVFGALMVFTLLTVYAARFDLGPLNTFIAMAIAVTKATLVVLYFMHLRHSPRLTQFVVAAGFLWLVILIALTVSDYWSRNWLQGPKAW